MHDNNTTLIVDTIQNELKLIFELSKQFKSKPNLPSTLLIASLLPNPPIIKTKKKKSV